MSPREIDALVAEHCMGWHEDDGIWCDADNELGPFVEDWRPSTDPAHSQQLKDKMRPDGWEYDISTGPAGMVSAEFFKPCGDCDRRSFADTELMAVALAALSAVGKPVAP